MKSNPKYEAGFRRVAIEGDESPEDLLAQEAQAAKRRKWIGAAAVLVAIGVVAGGVAFVRRDTPAKQLASAKSYIQKHDHASAIIELKRSLQGDPKQPVARFLLGTELSEQGDVSAAEIEYRKALQDGYPRERVIEPLVQSLLDEGKYDQVVTTVNEQTVDSPEINASLQTMLGSAYMALDKIDAGNGAFALATELVPNFAPALIARARYMAAHEQYDAAAKLLDGVAPDDKRQGEVFALRGDMAQSQHKTLDAIAAYQEAVKRSPDIMLTRLNLAQTYVENNQLDEAQAQINVVVAKLPQSAKAQFVAALIAFQRKDFPTARTAIAQSVQISPGDGNAQILAGMIALQAEDLVEAELHLRQGLLINPQSVQGRQILASLYLQRHELAKAEDVLRPLADALPDNRDVAALSARIAVQRGDVAQASRRFDRLSQIQTNDASASVVGASLRFAAGNTAAGFALLDGAAKAHPDDPEVDVAMLMARLRFHQVDLAQAAWQRLKAKQPDKARTYNLLALIDGARKDPVAARQSMEKAVSLDPQYFQAVAGLALLDVDEGKVDQARARLKALIATTSHPAQALLLLARIEGGSGASVETVATILEQARKADPRSEAVIDDLIAFHASHNETAKEIADVQQGLAISPNSQFYLYTLGTLMQRTGRANEALAAFTRLTTLNSENPEFQARLGKAQLALNQNEEALRSFREMLKNNPKRVDLQVKTMSALLDGGKIDEAKRMLFEISQLAPDSPILKEYDADIKFAQKDYFEAISTYRQAMSVAPNSQLVIKTVVALDAAKQKTEATAVLTDWSTKHPNDELVIAFEGQRAIGAKDYNRAIDRFRQLVTAHPNDPRLLNNLAWALAQRKDPTALDYATKATKLAPGDADAADTLGMILIQQGEVARGIEVIAKASAQAPEKLEIRLHLAKAQLTDGRKDAARATLQALVTAAPESAEGRESKGLLSTL